MSVKSHSYHNATKRYMLLAAWAVVFLSPVLAAPARPHRPRAIAFIRHGDIWTTTETGQPAGRLTRDRDLSGLAADGRKLACGDGNRKGVLCVLAPPSWRLTPIARQEWIVGAPRWLTGRQQLLAAREAGSEHGDNGLWLIDVRRKISLRILPATDFPFNTHETIRLSASKRRVAASGTITSGFWLNVIDLPSRRRILRSAEKPLLMGGLDFIWEDERTLLLACYHNEDMGPECLSGIRRLDVRKGKHTAWGFAGQCVNQILRAPGGEEFAAAIVQTGPGFHDLDLGLASRIVIANRRTGRVRTVPVPGPSKLCGYAADGSTLLLLSHPPQKAESADPDLYAVDLKRNTSRLIARDVTEAVWLQEAQE